MSPLRLFTRQDLIHVSIIFKKAHHVWPKGSSGFLMHASPTWWNGLHAETTRGRGSAEHGENIDRLLCSDFQKQVATPTQITSCTASPGEGSHYCGDSVTEQHRQCSSEEDFQVQGGSQHRVWIQWQPYHGQLWQKERNGCCAPLVDENSRKWWHSTTRPKEL